MKKRSLGLMIIYTIITLGIYQIFWLYNTKQELVANGQKVPPFKLLLAPMLGIIAIALVQFLTHFLFNSGSFNSGSEDMLSKLINILSILIGTAVVVCIIPITLYWYYKYCKATDAITDSRPSFGLSYTSLIVLNILSIPFIWPFIIQHGFNRLTNNPTATPQSNPLPSTPNIPPSF